MPSTTTGGAQPAGAYEVQQGDTLWGLSRKFGTSVDALVAANGIADPDLILTGQQLTITPGTTAAPSAPSKNWASPATPLPPAFAPITLNGGSGTGGAAVGALSRDITRAAGDVATAGLKRDTARPLDLGHQLGLKLISGKRPGGSSGYKSEHDVGEAIDMSNVPTNSRTGSAEMRAYAEAIRTGAGSGQLPEVKYVIYFDQIASARSGWKWRAYENPGGGNSPTERHLNHVHVSVK